jgi:hypothetical protein
MSRAALCALALGFAACRDVGIVGEGSACAEPCPSDEACVSGVCTPVGGAAGDGFEQDDHDDDHHDHFGERPPPDGH